MHVAEYVRARQRFSRQRLTVLFAYVTFIYPLFGALDAVVYPQHLDEFLRFRVLGFALGLPLLILSSRLPDRVRLIAGLTLVVYDTASVIWMCTRTDGFASPYVVGVILCFLGIATIEAFEPPLLGVVLVGMIGYYSAANTAVPFRTADAFTSLSFLLGAALFCVVSATLMEEQRRRLFAANSELRKRNDELEHARQQQHKFLSTISHELRSPVNSMLGFVELIEERESSLQPKSQENLKHVQRSGEHLLRLINDLLDLAKAEAGRMEIERQRFDLAPILGELLEQTRALVRGRPVMVSVHAPERCELESDPLRVRQILLNLLSNAAKFTSVGFIDLYVKQCGASLVIEVTDTGIGIPQEARHKIFEAFRQVHQGLGTGGTGLGLSIVSHLVELLGGTIEVESEVGKGSTFRLTLSSAIQKVAA